MRSAIDAWRAELESVGDGRSAAASTAKGDDSSPNLPFFLDLGAQPALEPADARYATVWDVRRRRTLEHFPIQLDEGPQVRRDIFFREDRRHRTLRFARAAINALIRVDQQLFRTFINAVDGTHIDARLVLDADAGFG